MWACKQCKRILNGKICPVCKIEGTRNFQGTITIFDTNSEVAKKMGITAPGTYAIKV
ncbi:MAG: DNA-directed RNA polymerase subunit E'' [Candidatus Aenigmarchaeota archaeon]|nr:DNA-directed RNA polymerase subunit E'' [Candidatus Aenigmarchaeota archaeon]